MEEYALYAVKSIFQIRKSQQNIKLDRDLWSTAKNYSMDIEIFDSDENQVNYINENRKKRDKKDIDNLTTDLYSCAVAITCMC